MAQQILKYVFYQLDIDNVFQIPAGAQVLCAQNQSDTVTLWALTEDSDLKARTFRIYATGDPLATSTKETLTYIGTVQIRMFVWHVFEVLT